MTFQRAILFRFHSYFEICRNKIDVLRARNPHIPIYGVFGGETTQSLKADKLPFDDLWSIPLDDPYWKWLHGDLVARWWFKERGKKLPFDMLHIVEWDLLLLKSIDELFSHITDGVALTWLKPLSQRRDHWTWTAPMRGREEWKELHLHVKKNHGYAARPLSGIFPGAAMSRAFLEKYAQETVPSYCNDEVRLPLYAQCYGMRVHDTKLHHKHFNAEGKEISTSIITKEYRSGKFAFHPVRSKIQKSLLK